MYKIIHVYVECLESADEYILNNNIKACILCPVKAFGPECVPFLGI